MMYDDILGETCLPFRFCWLVKLINIVISVHNNQSSVGDIMGVLGLVIELT